MKRLFLLISLFITLPLAAKENWIISGAIEMPYFAETFSPGFSLKADVLMFPWNLDGDPGNDGYGLSMETGILFPVRESFSGTSPYVKLGLIGRKEFRDRMSMDFKGHVLYALTGRDMPGNGLGGRRILYTQNIGISLSSSFVYEMIQGLELNTGINAGILFPLESMKGSRNKPGMLLSAFFALSCNIE